MNPWADHLSLEDLLRVVRSEVVVIHEGGHVVVGHVVVVIHALGHGVEESHQVWISLEEGHHVHKELVYDLHLVDCNLCRLYPCLNRDLCPLVHHRMSGIVVLNFLVEENLEFKFKLFNVSFIQIIQLVCHL